MATACSSGLTRWRKVSKSLPQTDFSAIANLGRLHLPEKSWKMASQAYDSVKLFCERLAKFLILQNRLMI
ncbi:MAG: hypothetical protein EPO23_11685 [Xanthobacteraceae bacterium]|nr:MAG: hypothetical protein EPO23_11685 [Xanthobacteraceae bacterium]